VITAVKPLARAKQMPVRADFDTRPAPLVTWLGITVILAVVFFFILFR